MIIDVQLVEEAREIVTKKVKIYDSNFNFDNDGRMILGQLPINKDAVNDNIYGTFKRLYSSIPYKILMGFLNSKKWDRIKLYSISGNMVEIRDNRDRDINIKLIRLLNMIESYHVAIDDGVKSMYHDARVKIEALLAVKGDDLILSINPIDFLIASGNNSSENPTSFSSCLGTMVESIDDGYKVSRGSYSHSNPLSLYTMGCINNRAILYIRNSNKLTVGDFELYGYRQRVMVWSDGSDAYLEVFYPTNTGSTLWVQLLEENSIYELTDSEIYNPDIEGIKAYNITGAYTHLDKSFIGDNYIELHAGHTCRECGDRVDEDYSYFHDDEIYCEHCFDELFVYCVECGGVESREDAGMIDGYDHCNSCFYDRVGVPVNDC